MMIATTLTHTMKIQQTIHRMLVRQVEGIALLASSRRTH